MIASKRKYAQDEDDEDSFSSDMDEQEQEQEQIKKLKKVKPPPPSFRDKFKSNKMAVAKLASKRSSITVKSVDQSRALARKGFEKLFSDILSELKDVNKTMDFKDPVAISTSVEQEMFDAYATLKSDCTMECGEAVSFFKNSSQFVV